MTDKNPLLLNQILMVLRYNHNHHISSYQPLFTINTDYILLVTNLRNRCEWSMRAPTPVLVDFMQKYTRHNILQTT